MLNKYSQILLKIIYKKELTQKENSLFFRQFNSILKKASENRIEFLFLKTIKKNYKEMFNKLSLNEMYGEGENKISDFQRTISFFQDKLNELEYAIIKTYYSFPAIVSDIDILFFDKKGYDDFVGRLAQEGFSYKEDGELKGSLQKSGFMKCEPHNDISWHGMSFVSKDFIKNNLTKKRVGQSVLTIPNNKATFVISLAHILFDCEYLSIRDYLVLKKSVKDKTIVEACMDEADKFGWKDAAEYLISLLQEVKKASEGKTAVGQMSFPFWIPIMDMYAFFRNKLIFDFREKKENHLSFESIFFPFIYYFWKRLRSKFSKRIYRNSWLY